MSWSGCPPNEHRAAVLSASLHCFVTGAGPLGWPCWERLAPPSVPVSPLEMCCRSSSVVHISVQWSCSLDQNGRVTLSAAFTEWGNTSPRRAAHGVTVPWAGGGARVVWPSSFPLLPQLHPRLPPNSGLTLSTTEDGELCLQRTIQDPELSCQKLILSVLLVFYDLK